MCKLGGGGGGVRGHMLPGKIVKIESHKWLEIQSLCTVSCVFVRVPSSGMGTFVKKIKGPLGKTPYGLKVRGLQPPSPFCAVPECCI